MDLDNNFLASPNWKQKLEFFIANKIKINFNQGLDIRMIDSERARLLSQSSYYDKNFTKRRLYFAFDNPADEEKFHAKLRLVLEYIPAGRIMIYMLVGFNTSWEQDWHRFKVIDSYGCDPFVMVYNNRKDDKRLRDFARWVNRRMYRTVRFEDYDRNR